MKVHFRSLKNAINMDSHVMDALLLSFSAQKAENKSFKLPTPMQYYKGK